MAEAVLRVGVRLAPVPMHVGRPEASQVRATARVAQRAAPLKRYNYTCHVTDTQQVPFWLQLLAIILAPGLGFAGVAIGATVTSRTSMKLALRAHRQDVYSSFLETVSSIHKSFTVDLRIMLLPASKRELVDIVTEIGKYTAELARRFHEIELVASARTAAAADNLLIFYMTALRATKRAHDDENALSLWHQITDEAGAALAEFRAAAAIDLGLPMRDRKRKLTKRASKSIEKWLVILNELAETDDGNDSGTKSKSE